MAGSWHLEICGVTLFRVKVHDLFFLSANKFRTKAVQIWDLRREFQLGQIYLFKLPTHLCLYPKIKNK